MPHLTSFVSVILVFVSVGALIHFIHHISSMMGAPAIAERLSSDLNASIEHLYPEVWGEADKESPVEEPRSPAAEIRAFESGYVQRVDERALVEIASKRQAYFRLRKHPGDFVIPGAVLLEVHPPDASDDELVREVNRAYVLGRDRTTWQDPEFAIKQLVEVALHALSPALNEPFTALTVIDRLGEGLATIARRPTPAAVRCDASGRPRLAAERQTFESLLRAGFDPIRIASGENPAIPVRMLDTIAMLAEIATRDSARHALRYQAGIIHRWAHKAVADPDDAAYVEERYRAAVDKLGQVPGAGE